MGTSQTGTPNPACDTGTNDRREAQRRNVVDSHLITVDLAFQSGALLLDLSEAGVGVQALASAPIGTTTTIRFELPETGGNVDGVGRIAWTDSSGRLGIRFEEVAELSRLHLAQWLARERRPAVASTSNAAMPQWPPLYERDEIAALRRDLTTEKLEGEAALGFVVERIRNVTRATGAAIALEDGSTVLCRASSGNAPGIGARLDPNSGLSGECIRTGEIVRCEDTETDPRADRLVCRKLELRSIVIVPIRIQGRPAGVLEAFSSRAHAFQSSDVLLLRRVSDLVAGIAIRQPETLPPISGPQALMAAATVQPHFPEPLAEAESVVETEAPLMMDDIFTVVEQAEPEVVSEPVMAAPPAPVTPKAETTARVEATAPTAAEVATRVEAPSKETDREVPRNIEAAPAQVLRRAAERTVVEPLVERHPLSSAAPAPAPGSRATVEEPTSAKGGQMWGTLEIPAAQPVQTETRVPEAPAAVAREAAVPSPIQAAPATSGGFAAATAPARIRPVEYEYSEEADEAIDSDELLASMAPQIPSPWRLRLTGAAILLAVVAIGGWQVWRAVAPPPGTPMDSEIKPARPAGTAPLGTPPTATPAPTAVSTSLSVTVPPPTAASSGKPSAAEPAVKTSATPATAKTAAPGKTTTKPEAPIEVSRPEPVEGPPSVALASGSSNISSLLAAPVASPKLDRPVVSEMTGGKLIQRFDPIYPKSLSGLHGEVVLKAMINKKGEVSRVTVVSGQALLAQSAVAAVRRWRYEPFRLNGVPIEIENTIVVNFKTPGQ